MRGASADRCSSFSPVASATSSPRCWPSSRWSSCCSASCPELHLGHERGRPLGHRSGRDGAHAQGDGARRPAARALRQVRRQARHGRSRHLVPHARAGDQADRRAGLAVAEARLRRDGLRHLRRRHAGLSRRAEARQPDRHRLDGRRDLGPVAVAVLVRPDADVPVRAEAELAAELRLRRRRPAQPHPAGGGAGRRPDGAAGAHHARRRARRAQRRFRAHRAQQGHERAPGREMARAAQRAGAGRSPSSACSSAR